MSGYQAMRLRQALGLRSGWSRSFRARARAWRAAFRAPLPKGGYFRPKASR
jgi:hypothetical protein